MDSDVIVIGAGPAGSAAVFFLASRGLDVICIERLDDRRYSRYHSMCGECISDAGLRVIGIRDEEVRNRINRFRLDWPGGVRTEFKVKGYIISRVSILNRLRKESEAKDARFVSGVVTSVVDDGDICKVVLCDGRVLTSRYLIGADGANSVTRRCIFGSEPHRRIPVEIRVSDEPAVDNTLVFKLKGRGRFYEWLFPSGAGSSIGAVRHNLEDGPGVHGGRLIPIGWVDEFVSGHVALVGDAAGFVNPLSFGGLRIAFESARHAADAIAASNLESYDHWWRSSPLSDRRFEKVTNEFAGYDDSDYAAFSRHLGNGLYLSGVISVILHPTRAWIYFGCLMAMKNGW